MHSRFTHALRQLRRSVLPPTAADITRRFNALSIRLDRLEIANQVLHPNKLDSLPAQQRELLPVLRLIRPRRVPGCQKVRMGSPNDGGYVMLDDFSEVSCGLSFGISDNDSWDLGVAERGVLVHQFDHSVKTAPSSHPFLRFHKKMISTRQSPHSETMQDLIQKYSKGGSPDVILKMDIEGDEWAVLDDCPPDLLRSFTQVICEFHDLHRLGETEFLSVARRVFEKMAGAFSVIHVHANNWGVLFNIANIPMPDVLEITFANKERYSTTDDVELFPTPLDMANHPGLPDICLGAFRF